MHGRDQPVLGGQPGRCGRVATAVLGLGCSAIYAWMRMTLKKDEGKTGSSELMPLQFATTCLPSHLLTLLAPPWCLEGQSQGEQPDCVGHAHAGLQSYRRKDSLDWTNRESYREPAWPSLFSPLLR